jgi:beta-aspartyl-peptidase (threonine type)
MLHFLLFLAMLSARSSTNASDPPEIVARNKQFETQVKAVLDAQVSAWNKGDIDGFMAGYWKDDRLTFVSGGDITRGWEATRARYIKRYQAEGKEKMGKLGFSELEIEIQSTTIALVHGRFDLVRGDKKDWGRFTLLVRRLPDDSWRIVHDHTSVPVEKPTEKKEAPPKK